jgi:hypothetical protein
MQVMPSYVEECKCISLQGKDIVKICTYLFIPFKLHVVHILFHLPNLMPVEYHDALMSSIRTAAFPPYFEDKKFWHWEFIIVHIMPTQVWNNYFTKHLLKPPTPEAQHSNTPLPCKLNCGILSYDTMQSGRRFLILVGTTRLQLQGKR